MKAWRKVRNSIFNRRSRWALCVSAQRSEMGTSKAHQAFSVQASDAITK